MQMYRPFFFKRYQRYIMFFNQIAEKSGISLFVSKIADSKRCFLICFQDSRNGLFSQGPEAISLSLTRQGGGILRATIRRAEAKPRKPLAGLP